MIFRNRDQRSLILATQQFFQLWQLPFDHLVGVFIFWEYTVPCLLHILLKSRDGFLAQIFVFFNEFRCKCLKNSENVTADHQLTIGFPTRTDAVYGNIQPVANNPANFRWNGLYQQSKGAGFFNSPGIFDQFFCSFGRSSLGFKLYF